jgi:hypothetical protein
VSDSASYFTSDRRYRAFTAVKYITYALLSFNIYVFLTEELTAAQTTYVDGIPPGQLIQAFSASIDTSAWVLLLLLFELETSVLDDTRLHGWVKWSLHGFRGLCYLAIGYAFTGYLAELTTILNTTPLDNIDFCSVIDQRWSLLLTLDEYAVVDAGNCAAITADSLRITSHNIVAEPSVLQSSQYLAWADVINSATWILVVIVLENEVRLQLRGNLSAQIIDSTRYLKYFLYGVLFGAAIYWGVVGAFIDFWDASLWLFAFLFIELNVFEWQHETREQRPTDS